MLRLPIESLHYVSTYQLVNPFSARCSFGNKDVRSFGMNRVKSARYVFRTDLPSAKTSNSITDDVGELGQ